MILLRLGKIRDLIVLLMFGMHALCGLPCSSLCLTFLPEEWLPTPLEGVKRSSFRCNLTLRFLQLSHFISTQGHKAPSRGHQPRPPPPLWWGHAAPAKGSAHSHPQKRGSSSRSEGPLHHTLPWDSFTDTFQHTPGFPCDNPGPKCPGMKPGHFH